MKITYAELSEKGTRQNNEDYVLAACEKRRGLFAVADGLGGHERGQDASRIACGQASAIYHSGVSGRELLKQSFVSAQKALLKRQEELGDRHILKTTLVLLTFENEQANWGHIGDTRLYLFRHDGSMICTKDHSVPQMLVMLGEIDAEDIRTHEDRNRVLKVLGAEWQNDEAYELCTDAVTLIAGDVFLLATDGFWELVTEEQMMRTLKLSESPKDWLRRMTRIVKKTGEGRAMDNYSAIAVFAESV